MEVIPTEIITEISERLMHFKQKLLDVQIQCSSDIVINSADYRNNESIKEITDQIVVAGKEPIIYIISCENEDERYNLINKYNEFQKSNSETVAYNSRINVARSNKTNNPVLYLGSSINNIRTRISQHLGKCDAKTYSLHLSKWDGGINYNIRIQTFKILTDIEPEHKRKFVEMIEQELWDKAKPVFGKQSGL